VRGQNGRVQGSEFDEAAAIEPMGNDERVDVLVARAVPTVDGVRVAFDDFWPRRRVLEVTPGVVIAVPALDDLILTKRFGGGTPPRPIVSLTPAAPTAAGWPPRRSGAAPRAGTRLPRALSACISW
jgi:hypothetical protein